MRNPTWLSTPRDLGENQMHDQTDFLRAVFTEIEQAAQSQSVLPHGPDQVLADVAAKRKILDLVEKTQISAHSHPQAENLAGDILELLARGYSHHPGYQAEWDE